MSKDWNDDGSKGFFLILLLVFLVLGVLSVWR